MVGTDHLNSIIRYFCYSTIFFNRSRYANPIAPHQIRIHCSRSIYIYPSIGSVLHIGIRPPRSGNAGTQHHNPFNSDICKLRWIGLYLRNWSKGYRCPDNDLWAGSNGSQHPARDGGLYFKNGCLCLSGGGHVANINYSTVLWTNLGVRDEDFIGIDRKTCRTKTRTTESNVRGKTTPAPGRRNRYRNLFQDILNSSFYNNLNCH